MVISYHNFAYVCGVECIHVLIVVNCVEDSFFIYVLRKGKLTEDTVNGIVVVELFNKLKQLLLSSAFGKLKAQRFIADIFAGFFPLGTPCILPPPKSPGRPKFSSI